MTNSPIQHSSIPRAAPQRKGGIFRSMGKVENSCAKPHMDPSVSGPKRRQQPNGKSRRRCNSQQQDLKHVRWDKSICLPSRAKVTCAAMHSESS